MFPAAKIRSFATRNIISSLKYARSVEVNPNQKQFHTSYSRWQVEKYFQKRPGKDRTNIREMGYVLLIIPIAGACLGTWQVRRRKWKLQLIEDLKKTTEAPCVKLPTDLSQVDDLEYCHVSMQGRFDHSKELYVMPRGLLQPGDKPSPSSGLISAGKTQTGAHVITAFQLADSNERILVNRGWVPRNKINPATRSEGQVTGDVDLVGIVRLTEKRQSFGMSNDVAKNQWFRRDVEAMAEQLNTQPIWVDADWDTSVPGGPVGGQTRVSLRNEHMSYIFTWYSLSAITFSMWYMRYWK